MLLALHKPELSVHAQLQYCTLNSIVSGAVQIKHSIPSGHGIASSCFACPWTSTFCRTSTWWSLARLLLLGSRGFGFATESLVWIQLVQERFTKCVEMGATTERNGLIKRCPLLQQSERIQEWSLCWVAVTELQTTTTGTLNLIKTFVCKSFFGKWFKMCKVVKV